MLDFIKNLKDKVVKSSTVITVNGQVFTGNNVSVVNGKVIVDGKEVDLPEAKEINISIEGDLASLHLDSGKVDIAGHAGDVSVGQGTVTVGMDVKGTLQVDQGKVQCQDVYSDVRVSMGNVKASTIHGSATTKMGNVSH